MAINLLDLAWVKPETYKLWSDACQATVMSCSNISAGDIVDEDACITDQGDLVISASIGDQVPELTVTKGEWGYVPFQALREDVALWLVNTIAQNTPRDQRSKGVDWSGEVFGIPCRGYQSPDGMALRFMYNGEGPFQALSDMAVFGFSLGDAAPMWAHSS